MLSVGNNHGSEFWYAGVQIYTRRRAGRRDDGNDWRQYYW